MLVEAFLTFLIAAWRIMEGQSNSYFILINDTWFLLAPIIFIMGVYYYLFKWAKLPKKQKLKKIKNLAISKNYPKLLARATLPNLIEYSQKTLEYPEPDDENWLNIDYTTFYKKYAKSINKPWIKPHWKSKPWSPELCEDLILDLSQAMQDHGEKYVVKITPKTTANFIIFGDFHGAFHSLLRNLSELKKIGIINDNLKLNSKDDYVIFNGNVINRSPYVLETLSIVLFLIKNNPNQVFYIKGNHEQKEMWINYHLFKELKLKIRKDNETLVAAIDAIFTKLPLGVYIKAPNEKKLTRISHYGSTYEFLLDEAVYQEFLLKDTGPGVSFFALSNDPVNISHILCSAVRAIIVGKEWIVPEEMFAPLALLLPENAATTWRIFSAPILAYKKFNNFIFDAFVILNTSGKMNHWIVQLYSQDVDQINGYTLKHYSLIYGMEVSNQSIRQPLNYDAEIPIGTSMDLSNLELILSARIATGLQAAIIQKNENGGINNCPLRLICLDDGYNPTNTLKNIKILQDLYHVDLILSPVGSSTSEAFISFAKDKKLLVMFPISGSNNIRLPKLDHFIHYRTSYFNEGVALVHYAIETLDLRRFAFYYQQDGAGLSVLDGAEAELKKYDHIEYIKVPYDRFVPDIDACAKKIIDFNPNAIFFFSNIYPSIALINKLGVNNLADKALLGISFLTDDLSDYLKDLGLSMTITRLVPNIYNENLPIIDEYKKAIDKLGDQYSFDSFEAYLNANIMFMLLEAIEPPITLDKIIKVASSQKNINFKGVILNYDPKTHEFSKDLWIERLK